MTQYRNSKWLNLTAAAALLLAVLILFQFLYQKDNKYTNGPPYGSQGVFAFSARDLTGSRPLFLIDGWEFYPDSIPTVPSSPPAIRPLAGPPTACCCDMTENQGF